jgi:2-polyprenyl-6-methoxyphenol hydroxylase-like FAD-dependent oxidoreductase
MLEMLVEEAARHASFTFIRGAAVRGLIVEDARITGVEILARGRTQTLGGDLVIGADGRASTVRRKAGLEIIRRPQHFDIVWCRVPMMANDGYDGARVFVGNRHFALAYPTYDGRLQVAWVIRKGAIGELRSRGIEHWIAEMASHVSSKFGEHLRSHVHDVTQPFLLDVICDLMPAWTKPGLLLIGDAAHPMSPVGGQGINIALRDAVVAANRLVSILADGKALRPAMDVGAKSIQDERMDEVQTIQRMQQLAPRLLFASPIISRSFIALIPLLAATGLANGAARRFVQELALGAGEVRLKV